MQYSNIHSYFPRLWRGDYSELDEIRGEKWIAHPIYKYYSVSDKGRIRVAIGIEDGRLIYGLLIPSFSGGRLTAKLKLMPGDSSKKYVDVLVLQCFYPCEIKDYVFVPHKNGEEKDCSLENLEWDCKS